METVEKDGEGAREDATVGRTGGAGQSEANEQLAFDAEVEANLKRNFTAHLIHGLLGQTGFRIIQAPTFVPAYVFQLTGSNALVGLARACQALGMFLTPIAGATLIERRRKVMPVVFATGALMRLQVLGLALSGFYLGVEANAFAVCLFLGLFGFFTGMQVVTFSFLISKIIPVDRRGRLVGLRDALAGLTASGVGIFGGYLIRNDVLGNGYASLFLVSFGLTALGLMSLLLMREPASLRVLAAQPLRTRLQGVGGLLRRDPNFRAYLLARALGATGRMAEPYYVLYSSRQLGLDAADVGWLTGAFLVAQTVSNMLWGATADRQGFRNTMAYAMCVWIGAALLLLSAPSFAMAALGFVALGAGLGGFRMSSMNMVLEFGSSEHRPMRIALAQSAEQGISIAAPLLGGLLAEQFSYPHVFWLAVTLQLISLLMIIARVRDPRRMPSASE